MKQQRVYLDTAVIGGCFDEEFASWSNGLMMDFRLGRFRPVVSELVAAEIEDAPPEVEEAFQEEIGTPGTIDYEANMSVRRSLLRDVFSYLEKTEFWQSEGQIPRIDGYSNFVEVQLGNRYGVVHLSRFLKNREPLPRLISEAGMAAIECSRYPSEFDHSNWLLDERIF